MRRHGSTVRVPTFVPVNNDEEQAKKLEEKRKEAVRHMLRTNNQLFLEINTPVRKIS